MAGLDMLGGMLQGAVNGYVLKDRMNKQDEALKIQKEQAANANEQFGWQRDQEARAKVERERKLASDKLMTTVAQEMPDASPYEQQVEWAKRASQEGIVTKAEMDAANAQTATLRKAFGQDALNKLVFGGDATDANKYLGKTMPGHTLTTDGKTITLAGPNGAVQKLDRDGTAMMFGIYEASKEFRAAEKDKVGIRKTEAEIKTEEGKPLVQKAQVNNYNANANASNAQAGLAAANTQNVRAETPGTRAKATGLEALNIPEDKRTPEQQAAAKAAQDRNHGRVAGAGKQTIGSVQHDEDGYAYVVNADKTTTYLSDDNGDKVRRAPKDAAEAAQRRAKDRQAGGKDPAPKGKGSLIYDPNNPQGLKPQ
jgi:hypothetical protein